MSATVSSAFMASPPSAGAVAAAKRTLQRKGSMHRSLYGVKSPHAEKGSRPPSPPPGRPRAGTSDSRADRRGGAGRDRRQGTRRVFHARPRHGARGGGDGPLPPLSQQGP